MKIKKKIFCLIPTMRQGGGAAKIFLYLAQYLQYEYKVTIVSINHEEYHMPSLPSGASLHNLDCKRARYAPVKLFLYLINNRPDIVLTTAFRLDTLIGLISPLLNYSPKLISRCINMPSELRKNYIMFQAFKLAIKRFDKVITQSTAMSSEIIHLVKQSTKVEQITNPISPKFVKQSKNVYPEEYNSSNVNLVSIGSLVPQKQFEFMIKVLCELDSKYKLYIIGNGENFKILGDLIETLKLTHQVYLLGFKMDVIPYLFYADFYLSTSLYEGCPNSVIEALACGTPVISLNYPAIYDLIEHKKNGIIVTKKYYSSFAKAIVEATSHRFDRESIKRSVLKKHHMKTIMHHYENVLLS